MIGSLRPLVDDLSGALTRLSLATASQFLLGWIMCLGQPTLCRAAHSVQPQTPADHSARHGLDRYCDFFERSALRHRLADQVGVLVPTRLTFLGGITLLVKDTMAHTCGRSVRSLGWWRDAVTSTQKRIAAASGHNWVVLAVAHCLPFSNAPVLALPLPAHLQVIGRGPPEGGRNVAPRVRGRLSGRPVSARPALRSPGTRHRASEEFSPGLGDG